LFVSNNSFLLIKENNESANESIEINDEGKNYFVVVVYAGKEITGFIALNRDKPEIISKEVTLRKLFKTTSFIKKYAELKNQLRQNASVSWFFSEYLKAKGIAALLEDEKQELTIIDNALKKSEATNIINKLKSELDLMSFALEETAEKMKSFSENESNFILKPTTGKEEEIVEAIKTIAEEIIAIQETALEYNSDLTLLQAQINNSDLDIQSKQSLMNYSKLPADFQQIVIYSWFSNAETISNSVKQLLENAANDSITKTSNFLLRIKRNNVMNEIFSLDPKLEALGEQYNTLSKAANIILNAQNRDEWEDQASLALFEEQWNKTNYFFQKEDYDTAMTFAEKAKNNAIKIINAGLKEEEKAEPINQSLLINIAIALTALLIVIIVYRNRGKIFGKKEKEKIDVYEY